MANPEEKKKPVRTWPRTLLRRSGAALAAVLAFLLILIVVLASVMGTESGRLWLLAKGLEMGGLTEGPLRIALEDARSPSLGEWYVERLTVSQEREPWVDIHQLHLQWQPRVLLQGRLLVDRLHAAQLDFYQQAGTEKDAPEAEREEGGLPALPGVAVEAFGVERLNILTPGLELPTYDVAGSVRLFWDALPLELGLTVDSLPHPDHAPMSLTLSSTAESQDQLRLKGTLQEGEGGLVAELLRLPPGSAIDAEFEALVKQEADDYALTLVRLEMPFMHHQLAAEGELAFDDENQSLLIDRFLLSTGEHQHRVQGRASKDALALQVELNQFPLDLLSPWVKAIEQGQVSAQVDITGAPTDPTVSGRLTGTAVHEGESVDLETAGSFNQQQLKFDQLALTLGVAELSARGTVDLQGTNSDVAFELYNLPASYLELAHVEVPDDVTGRLISAKGRLRGDLRNPSGSLTAKAEGSYREQPLTASVRAEGTRGRINIEAATLRTPDARASVSGLLDLQGDQSDLKLALRNLPVSLLELADVDVPPGLEARLNGSASVTGALTSPQARGELSAAGTYQDQAFSLEVAGSGDQQHVRLRQAEGRVGEASLAASGTVNFAQGHLDIQTTLSEAPLSLLELAQVEVPDGLSATLSGSAALTGPLRLPQVKSELRAEGVYEELPFQLIADGSFIDRRVELDLVQLTLDGTTALEASGYLHPDSYDLRLQANDLPTQTLSALGWDLVTGDFTGQLHLQGTPEAPSIEGQFAYSGTLTGLDLATGEKVTFELGWNTELTTEEDVLLVQSVFTRNQQTTGNFSLNAPLTEYLTHFQEGDPDAPLPIAFTAHGAVDLAIMSLVVDPDIHRVSGRAAVRMEGSGTVAEPDLTGVFEILNGRYQNTLTGTLLTDVQLLLRSRGSNITIEEATARDTGGGRLEASGTVNWLNPDSPSAVDIAVIADDVSLLNREDVDGEVSGKLTLTGSFEEMWLQGKLDVTPFAANIDAAVQSQVPEIEVTEVYGDPEEAIEESPLAASVGPTVHLDLTIEADQQAFLRGRGLEAELAGEIHLSGTLAEPHYEGEFTIVRGVFEVFGRKFTLDDGEVIFANNALYMLIPGEYEHEDYTIRAVLSGTVDDLSLKLSSVPDLPEDEILSLLIFGKSVQNVTPFQALRLAAAVRSLRSGGGGFDPIDSTREALGVDTLSVESATTESGTGVSVGVGKYLNDRVYLEVRRTPSEVQPWQGSVEIQLTPRLHLRSSTGGEGRTRADLLWKRDF
jgi:translocation and assembly module TamB